MYVYFWQFANLYPFEQCYKLEVVSIVADVLILQFIKVPQLWLCERWVNSQMLFLQLGSLSLFVNITLVYTFFSDISEFMKAWGAMMVWVTWSGIFMLLFFISTIFFSSHYIFFHTGPVASTFASKEKRLQGSGIIIQYINNQID